MKLDNRPKKLLVKGVREEGVQALRDWYEVRVEAFLHLLARVDPFLQTTGQVESLERMDSGDIIVTFRSRAAAEQVGNFFFHKNCPPQFAHVPSTGSS